MAYLPGQNGGQGPTPQQPQFVYVQPPSLVPGPSIDRVTVPFLLVVSAGAFIGWASWFGTTSINSIQSEIKGISVTLTNYIERQDERVDRIETVLDKRTMERWTKTDQELFCARTESIPGNKGWKCGKTDSGFARVDEPPIWRGVMEQSAPVADVGDDRSVGRWSQPKVSATP